MKEKKLFDTDTNVPDELVEKARETKHKQKLRSWKKWIALAACAALVIGSISLFLNHNSNSGDISEGAEVTGAGRIAPRGDKSVIITKHPMSQEFLNFHHYFQ